MFKKSLLVLSCLAAMGSAHAASSSPVQKNVDALATNLEMSFDIVTNDALEEGIDCANLKADYGACNLVNIKLTNRGETKDLKDWSIYFHSIRPVLAVNNSAFTITHVTGDLHKLEPTKEFKGFLHNKTHTIPIVSESWQTTYSDFMPRSFITARDAVAKNIASTDTEDTQLFVQGLDKKNSVFSKNDNNVAATAESRYENNSDIFNEDISSAILPTPKHVDVTGNQISIKHGLALDSLSFSSDTYKAILDQVNTLGIQNHSDGLPVDVVFKDNKTNQHKDDYHLIVTDKGIEITAHSEAGAFYAMQSLFNLYNPNNPDTLPEIEVVDSPRFEYRGFMVDVGRNFHSKESIKKTIDQMSAFKMNKLHLHLSEDEGWRLEIPGLPELTDVGSQRCFDLDERECLLPQLGSGANSDNFGSGYFTKEDYVEILKYAKARKVDVIPELDMPAHSRAAVVSMEARYHKYIEQGKQEKAEEYRLLDPQDTSNVTTVQFYDRKSFINPCLQSSKRFVTKVISEVQRMHNEAGMPLTTWHFGGDEAKNIKLGNGFQDINDQPVSGKGRIDLTKQHKPYEESPVCNAMIESGEIESEDALLSYFAEEVSKILDKQGITTFQAWQDGLKYSEGSKDFATENTRVNLWDTIYWGAGSKANELVNDGYEVVVSNPDFIYLDMPYEVDKYERGYYWATRATDTRKILGFSPENLPQNAETAVDRNGNAYTSSGTQESESFHGMSAALWSETIRTDEQYEYMAFPRLLAVAERSWNQGNWEIDYKPDVTYSNTSGKTDLNELNQEWNRFSNILGQRELAKVELRGINYRVPVPGAKIVDGILSMNTPFKGSVMEYSFDGKNWQRYTDKQKPRVKETVYLRSLSPSGDRSSRVISISG